MPAGAREALAPRSAPRESLLDRIMPRFDVAVRYAIVIAAARARVVATAEAYRLDRSPATRLLFRLRGLGAAPATLRASLAANRLTLLAETPGEEVVIGTFGRFWALAEWANMEAPADARAFAAFARPGWAKAAVNLRFDALGPTTTRVATETRVLCVDDAARRRFALYWGFIRPFSGVIRRILLRGIRDEALR